MSTGDRNESLVSGNFIKELIKEDVAKNRYNGQVVTRFPPEPNGYLHIGHAKAFALSFSVAEEFGGRCHLRFDDTNPAKEETEYVEAIKQDIKWMGFDWGRHLYFASDYFPALYEFALKLIKDGKAYVDHLSPDQVREYRGTLTEPGRESPHRNRSVEENLELFRQMKNGQFEEGECVLRAKIDMASPNLNMRDPVMYRIVKTHHHRTGDSWSIYPTYDFAHGQSDSIEGITHSLCDISFEDHRPLYDWFCENLMIHHPRQIEFARLNLTYTLLSKRLLRRLVEDEFVKGWDDPRMPTLSGLRRRGYTPQAIRTFLERIGVAKAVSTVDIALLEHTLREDLNKRAIRVMAVLRPLKLIIDNYPADQVEWLEAENNPEDSSMGVRKIPFSKVLYIEQEDFRLDPPRKYHRLYPGNEIRLKHAYYIRCVDVVRDKESGEVLEVHCTYDPLSRGGWSEDGRKVKGTSHWVSAAHALEAEVRLYHRLFIKENPEEVEERGDFRDNINPDSLEVLKHCLVEPSLAEVKPGAQFQFLRQGYFCADLDSTQDGLVFNRTVSLRDSWAKIARKLDS